MLNENKRNTSSGRTLSSSTPRTRQLVWARTHTAANPTAHAWNRSCDPSTSAIFLTVTSSFRSASWLEENTSFSNLRSRIWFYQNVFMNEVKDKHFLQPQSPVKDVDNFKVPANIPSILPLMSESNWCTYQQHREYGIILHPWRKVVVNSTTEASGWELSGCDSLGAAAEHRSSSDLLVTFGEHPIRIAVFSA